MRIAPSVIINYCGDRSLEFRVSACPVQWALLKNVCRSVCLQHSLKMAVGWSHEETIALVSVWLSPPLSSPTHKNSEISLRPLSQGNMPPS